MKIDKVREFPKDKMKDKQGVVRGKCTTPGCECGEYMAPQDSKGARCDYCDHVPVKHLKMIKLGACNGCGECAGYESEDSASYPSCSYCDCPAQRHKGAEQLITPVLRPAPPAYSSPQFPTQMMGSSIGGPRASMPPSGVMAPGGVPKCKIHTCNKPCYVEKGGRVHDFCGKSHADLYKKTMAQQAPMQAPQQAPMQAPQPVMHKQPVVTTTALFSKPPSSPSTMMIISQRQQPPPGSAQAPMGTPATKVCEKCHTYAANPNHKWCQRCYDQNS